MGFIIAGGSENLLDVDALNILQRQKLWSLLSPGGFSVTSARNQTHQSQPLPLTVDNCPFNEILELPDIAGKDIRSPAHLPFLA